MLRMWKNKAGENVPHGSREIEVTKPHISGLCPSIH